MDLKNYKIIKLVSKKPNDQLSNSEAKYWFDWFIKIQDDRLVRLMGAISSENKELASSINYSLKSLTGLGPWFKKHIHLRKMSPDELRIEQEFRKKYPSTEVQDKTLSDETISLCFDIGIYLARILIVNVPKLKWNLCTKKNIHYNRPVIASMNGLLMEPINLMKVQAFKVMNEAEYTPDLFSLYHVWAMQLKLSKNELEKMRLISKRRKNK